MADSPRCIKCLGKGLNGQTYRVVRTNTYKCSTCKVIYNGSSFKDEEFEWRDKNSTFYQSTREKFEKEQNKFGLKRLELIREFETK